MNSGALVTIAARMAVIAAAALACARHAAAALPVPPLGSPISVRFQLADGVRVSGEMTTCDDEGFDGSFGRRLWTELNAEDAWKLYERVMDAKASGDWVNLGRVMLQLSSAQPKAAAKADTAFRRAVQIDPEAQAEVDRVKQELADKKREARDAQRAAEAQKLTTISPEAGLWPADSWPALSEKEQAAAVLSMKADAQATLKQASASIAPLETAHFILYGELERSQSADLVIRLERVIPAMEFVLNPGFDPADKDKPNTLKPWGKIVLYIWKEQDRFKMAEAETFRHLVPNSAVAVCHFTGPRAFIDSWRIDDDEQFEWCVLTETVHALMHRYHSPKRLPAWANDGIAELVASRANKFSNFGHDRRKHALEFIRTGGSVGGVLDLKYDDGSFPGPDGVGASVGELIIELMMNQKPGNFVKWINAVKAGKDWVAALKDDYGVKREDLVNIATQYYMVND